MNPTDDDKFHDLLDFDLDVNVGKCRLKQVWDEVEAAKRK